MVVSHWKILALTSGTHADNQSINKSYKVFHVANESEANSSRTLDEM